MMLWLPVRLLYPRGRRTLRLKEYYAAPALLLLFMTAFIFTGCAINSSEKPAGMFNAAELQLHPQNGIMMQGTEPFTGIVFALADNKKDTLEMASFRKGKEHGEWKKFYPGGRPRSIRSFTNGKKRGDYLSWWPDGKQQFVYHFENGEYEGDYREWNAAGVLVNERTYSKGYEEGPQKQFYDDGRVKSNYVMIDGKRYGLLGTKNCVNVTDSIFKN